MALSAPRLPYLMLANIPVSSTSLPVGDNLAFNSTPLKALTNWHI